MLTLKKNSVKSHGYSVESLKKVVFLMRETEKAYSSKTVEEIKMCVSKGNRKIGRVMNVSIPPILSCGNCKECKHLCYDIKACLQYPNTVIDARVRNWVILNKDRAEYFKRIDEAISRRRTNKYFRWHVAGDIIDRDYFENMVKIANNHTDFIFWTYTKMYWIVNSWIDDNGSLPSNLRVMFSEWDGMPLDNPHNMPVFSCKLKAGNKNHPVEYFDGLYKCPGNCDICKACGRGCIGGENTFADEH